MMALKFSLHILLSVSISDVVHLIADMFDNMVTFRKPDATIEFPTFDAATSGDIRFQFKTTAENGIFLQNTGESHFIEVKLVCECHVSNGLKCIFSEKGIK